MPYYLYIHNIYLYQYHDTKPKPINIDWLLGLTPTSSSDLPHFGSPSNLFSLEKHLGGEFPDTPQKSTKSVPEKIDLVNQQPP